MDSKETAHVMQQLSSKLKMSENIAEIPEDIWDAGKCTLVELGHCY